MKQRVVEPESMGSGGPGRGDVEGWRRMTDAVEVEVGGGGRWLWAVGGVGGRCIHSRDRPAA